ncbi:MAG: LamG-like jellyroll fold domain-containing protein [Polyangiales bacterium]
MAAAQPVFQTAIVNGRPAVLFDGASTYLAVSAFPLLATASSAVTTFIVAEVRNFATQRFLVTEQFTPCVNNYEIGYHTGNQTGANFGLHSGCSNAVVTPDTMSPNWAAWGVRLDSSGASPSNVDLFVNGVPQARANNAGGYAAPGTYGSAANRLIIGARDNIAFGVIDGVHNGHIGEVVIYSRALTDAEVAQVSEYFRAKYATP